MEIKSVFIFVLYFGLACFRGAFAGKGQEVKRGDHPYMAFIYFSDPSIVDADGFRFIRSAVLIKEDWLITAAMGDSFINAEIGFPRKTLLARAGSISIDSNFTPNEDEDEQEREIVQIVRPYNLSATQWWTTDISLMKTLTPFKATSVVGVKPLNINRDLGKTCSVLVFAKQHGNMTADEKSLMQIFVEILTPSIDSCGNHFSASTMVCARDSDANNLMLDKKFCHGNSGGPLICDNQVVGLQTYIDSECNPPHLYQLLSAWENFITCGLEAKCHEEHCGNICDVTYKDSPITSSTQTPDEIITTTLNTTGSDVSIIVSGADTKVRMELKNMLEEIANVPTRVSTVTTTIEADDGPTTFKTVQETSTIKAESQEPDSSTRNVPETMRKLSDYIDVKIKKHETRRNQISKPQKKTKNSSIKNGMYIVDTLFFGFLVLVCL